MSSLKEFEEDAIKGSHIVDIWYHYIAHTEWSLVMFVLLDEYKLFPIVSSIKESGEDSNKVQNIDCEFKKNVDYVYRYM